MNIINLTGITIAFRNGEKLETIRPSGWRLIGDRQLAPTGKFIGDATIAKRDYARPELPPPEANTLYLVDPVVAEAMQAHDIHRDDVIVSHGASAERDASDRIVATRVFYIANP
jgi:hypothetical protein